MTNLAAQEISFSYGERPVLDRVSLQLRRGEVTVLLGGNGVGKTTLLHALAGQLSPDSGAAVLDELPLRSRAVRDISRLVALMPQHETREVTMAVQEVVSLGRCAHRGWWKPMTAADQDLVEDAIRITGLCELRERPVTGLSGGEWRRMILARSLAQDTSVLLLDEPTAGLDLKYQHDLLGRVRDFAKQRDLTVVMTLHDLNQAASYADRIALLAKGSLIALGAPAEVLTPELIRSAFGVSVIVMKHPVTGGALVVPMGTEAVHSGANADTKRDPGGAS